MKTIVLFDVDGTLTTPRQSITPELLGFLKMLHNHTDIGIVDGSDLKKMKEQLGDNLQELDFIDYIFSENGLISYQKHITIHQCNICQHMGEEKLEKFINFCLRYLADLDIPIKRGTSIELRQSMLNISPIGRNCSQHERDAFEEYDKIHHIRRNMITTLEKEFPDYDLKYSIGEQISFDVLGSTFDKTFCLQFLKEYDRIYFLVTKHPRVGMIMRFTSHH